VRVVAERRAPHLRTRARVECAEPAIVRRSDEHESARRDGWSRAAAVARELLALGQVEREPERRLPKNLSRDRIYRDEPRPRRALTRRGRTDGSAVVVVLATDRRVEAEERAHAVDARAVVGLL